MNRRPWTPEEHRFLTQNFGPMTMRQIGEKLGRSVSAVKERMRRVDKRIKVSHRWTAADVELLHKLGPTKCARATGRNVAACEQKLYLLRKASGTCVPVVPPWTQDEITKLVDMGAAEYAKASGRTYAACRQRLYLLRSKGNVEF